MIKVSVILPVYGVAEYIEKCTRSLLNQTLQEMEFLFVDDHGPDDSIDIVKRTIASHPRESQFRFLRPEHNLGAGMARNFAIPFAKGEYIAFVDSDDWIEPTMFEELYAEAKQQGWVELCCCEAAKDYLDGQPTEILRNPRVQAGEMTDDKRRYILSHYVSLFWTFLYKRDFLEQYHIRYPEERCADDSFFVSASLFTASSIAFVDKPFYHYLIRPGSVCTTKDSTKYQKRLIVFGKLLQFAKDNGVYDNFKNEVDYVYLKKGGLGSVFNYVSNSLEPRASVAQDILSEMSRQIPDYKRNPYYRRRMALRILVFLIRHCPHIAMPLIARYVKRTNQVI